MLSLSIDQQLAIARQYLPDLEHLGNGHCQATCPGAAAHTTETGARDFRLYLREGEMPRENCFHKSCATARDELMRQLYRAFAAACHSHQAADRARKNGKLEYLKNAPAGRPESIPAYNATHAEKVADLNPIPVIDDAWLYAHSPVAIPHSPAAWAPLLLSTLYEPGENVIIFTKFASQGQALYTAGEKPQLRRLEQSPPAPGFTTPHRPFTGYPKGAQNGVWFLTSPVTGDWQPNSNNRTKDGHIKYGRRHAACCTRFPYLVLESDEAPPAVWLRILTQLHDPIAAIYTSGGKSYHALIKINARTKEEFDVARREYILRLAALGADPAAITAVRLSRLPGCLRYGSGEGQDHKPYLDENGKPAPRLQTLLYLNPDPQPIPLIKMPTR